MPKIMLIFFILALAASILWADYSDVRNLSLSAEGISRLEIDCGAGFLEVYGDADLTSIEVEAEIIVDDLRDSKAEKFIEKYMRLSLDSYGSRARLDSYFDDNHSFLSSIFNNYDAKINLIVRLPTDMAVDIEDGSGYIRICEINNEVYINDGSGEMEIKSINGDLGIDDGSGEIDIREVNGRVEIDDGSGDVTAYDIKGDFDIDDGSGSLNIKNIIGDVEIDDGSGDLYVRDIDGDVIIDDGSGDINIEYVKKDVEIIDSGSGSLNIAHVEGKVRK